MKNYNIRTKKLADYIETTHSTIRQTAKVFNMAKSTVHYDLSRRLPSINYEQYLKIKKILNLNFNEKHLRGGEATKQKFLKKNKKV